MTMESDVKITHLDTREVRFLRKCVRYHLELRNTMPRDPMIKSARQNEIRALAETFVRET